MIVDNIFWVFRVVADLFISLLPDFPNISCGGLESLGQYYYWADAFIDMAAWKTVFQSMLVILTGVVFVKAVVWVWHAWQ